MSPAESQTGTGAAEPDRPVYLIVRLDSQLDVRAVRNAIHSVMRPQSDVVLPPGGNRFGSGPEDWTQTDATFRKVVGAAKALAQQRSTRRF